MPYDSHKDLPESVQNVLPPHAQDIYLAAFNNAWNEYKDPDDRHGKQGREEVSHKVAWSAVKQSFHKNDDGMWVKSS
ncbi:ChaB [Paraglaciecola sp. T6c]|uniref:ChaB family protein n=1 Tax=Pseudoalteromonas atlantica (strain T6c / ATCC BAA-1087) TaxID=3042615 RepID=UPI00005C5D86|nr:ChaB family protein [Paraglaciecola sp. T6c]ABG42109.1 ChaB [Paraglaciecola sp. T6c]